MKKIFLSALSIVILGGVVAVVVANIKADKSEFSVLPSSSQVAFIDSNLSEFKDLILSNLSSGEIVQKNKNIKAGITSHHLPTALPMIAEFYKTLAASISGEVTFVVLGPDHFERCRSSASVASNDFITPIGVLESDDDLVAKIKEAGAEGYDQCFDGEHSIGVQTVFIKYFFPNAKMVPIIFSASTSDSVVNKIVDALLAQKEKIVVIASVDFSHYHDHDEALKLDRESAKMIEDMNISAFDLKHVDSPAAVKLAVLFSKMTGLEPEVMETANSYEFTYQAENTTGYINAIFTDTDKSNNKSTLLFAGDVMLSRSVGDKMTRINDWRWPFLKIADSTSKADLFFGNLEGPISASGKNVGSIYSFRADPRVIDGLKYAGFDVVSVANNHIGDWSQVAMEDTFNILKEGGIEYAGGGINDTEAYSAKIKEVNGVKFGFLGYTSVGAQYTEADKEKAGIAWLDKETMRRDIESARKEADVVVASIHFGEEYQSTSNKYQQDIARSAIDAGASLVIGHHPHVVQEVEKYKDGYIAYSLGNFVFDQLFSKETMEGLMLKVVFDGKKIDSVEQIKTAISRDFQTDIMK